MTALLDTSVILAPPTADLPSEAAISVITMAELRVGVLLARNVSERARRLEQRDFTNVVVDALLPVSDLSLSSDLLAISERVAVADETLHPHEVLAIKLLRLLTRGLPQATPVEQARRASSAGQSRGGEHERERDL